MMRVTCGMLLCALLAGCAGGGSGEGRRLPLRDGAMLVLEGPAIADTDGDCLFRNSERGFCPGWVDILVRDARRLGERIAVSAYLAAGSNGAGVVVLESADGGRTWKKHTLGSPPTGFGGYGPYVYLHGSDTYVIWTIQLEGGMYARDGDVVWKLTGDPAKPYEVVRGIGLIGHLQPSFDGRARTISRVIDPRDGSAHQFISSWMPGEARATVGNLPCASCAWVYSLDGDGFAGYYDSGTWTPADPNDPEISGCVARHRLSTGQSETACVDRTAWPVQTTDRRMPIGAPVQLGGSEIGAARVWAENGQTFARLVIPGARPQPSGQLALGPGRPAEPSDTAAFVGFNERYRGLLPLVQEDGSLRLVRLRQGAPPQEVRFPGSPCRAGESCGDGSRGGTTGYAQFALPLEGDEWLVFYVVDSWPGEDANHQWLYLVRERFTFTDFGEAPASPDLHALYPDAKEMGAVERMCARAAGCFPKAVELRLCANFWASWDTQSPGKQAARERFLQTPAGCDAFRETWPEAAIAQADGCPDGCDCLALSTGIRTCRGSAPCGVECTANGGTCGSDGTCSLGGTVAECDQCTADGRIVTCADDGSGGRKVWSVVRCAGSGVGCSTCSDPATCTVQCVTQPGCTEGTRCDGATSLTCLATGLLSAQDCTASGGTCGPRGFCIPQGPQTDCVLEQARCAGTSLVACSGYREPRRTVDCKALGFGGCVEDAPLRAHCQ